MRSSRPQLLFRQIIFVLIFAGSFSCSSLMKKAFTEPKVSVIDTELEDIALSGAELLLTMAIDNPNSYGLTVNKFVYHLELDGQELVKGAKTEIVDIKGDGRTTFKLPLTLRYSGLSRGISGLLYKDSLSYLFTGRVTIDTPVGEMSFDINRDGDIPIPEKPDFSIEDVRVENIGLSEAKLIFAVKIDNNQEMALDLKKFNFNLRIQDEEVFSIAKDLQVKLTADKAVRFDVPVTFRLLGLSTSVLNTLRKGQIKYQVNFDLDMNSQYGPFSLPWKKSAQTNLY